jgi:hypothetical protein
MTPIHSALLSGFMPRSLSRYDGSQNRKNHHTGSVMNLPMMNGQISRYRSSAVHGTLTA